MHQVRAHLAWLGHPVAGDLLYGGESARVLGWEAAPGAPGDRSRHALHARRLGFEAPGGGERLRVESPLPADLAELLERLA
jgi:23S rRNA pseudouridine1911/1915/1917 synthase